MNGSWETNVVAGSLFATMAAYALFAGADFGGGIWDMLAGRTETGEKVRAAIDRSVTPVWEGNQVWIVLGFVLVWTAYPGAFAAVMTALFVPLSLSLLGIVLRGVGFGFRHETAHPGTTQLAGVLFAASSFIAPFFLGDVVGAVVTGRVRPELHGDVAGAWLAPAALLTGVLFVAACAYIGGVYLVGDSHRRGETDMVRYFSRRAITAGVVTGILAAANMVVLGFEARYVFHRLLTVALPLVLVSVIAGAAALVLIVRNRTRLLRIAGALAVAAVVAAWGLAQYPYLLPGTLTLQTGSAPTTSLQAELVVLIMAAVLVVPSFAYLYWLQQHGRLSVTEPSDELKRAVATQDTQTGATTAPAAPRGHPVVVTALIGAAVVELAREAAGWIRRRR